jgi:hypothetical protein
LPCQENAKVAAFHQISSFDIENASLFFSRIMASSSSK